MRRASAIFAVILALFRASDAFACNSCSGAAEMGAVLWMPVVRSTPSLRTPLTVATEFRATSANASTSHGTEALFDGRLLTSLRGQPTRWLSLESVYASTARYFTAHQSGHSAFVPVDLDLVLRVQTQRDTNLNTQHRLNFGGGIKLGIAPSLLDELGYNRPIQLQINAGTTDVLALTEYTFSNGAWSFLASIRARFTTTGRFSWRQGSSLHASVGMRYRFNEYLLAGVSVDPRGALSDTVEQMPVVGTGGVVLAATPLLLLQPIATITLSAAMSIPIAQWLREGSLDGIGFSLGFQWTPTFTQPLGGPAPRQRLLVG